jgi:hypothetical protein
METPMSFAKHPTPLPSLAAYEEDAYTWALQQAALLRAGRLEAIDAQNIAEEIEALGNSEYLKLESAYRVILLHLLKWDHQPSRRSASWAAAIKVQRIHATRTLKRNPGLKSRIDEALGEAYEIARIEATAETGLPESTFPAALPYDLDTLMTREIPWEG